MKQYISVCAFVVLTSAAVAQQPGEPMQVKLALPDQYEQKHDLAGYQGHVTVLLYGDRKGMPANQELGERLHVEFHPTAKGLAPGAARKVPVRPLANLAADKPSPDVFVIPVACIGNVPNLVKTVIRNQIKDKSPEVAVWLDFGDTMKGSFGMTAGEPNLVVIDAQGRLRFRAQGVIDGGTYQRMTQVIEYLRQEAAGLVPPAK